MGKLDNFMKITEIRILPYTIYKNKLKMVYRPKYKTRHYKSFKIEYEQNISLTQIVVIFSQISLPRQKKQKENKQVGPNQKS